MRALKTAASILVGFSLYGAVFQRNLTKAVIQKAAGGDQPCPWAQLARYPWAVSRFAELQQELEQSVKLVRRDETLPIQLMQTPRRTFWIQTAGDDRDGGGTLSYVLAEQEWISQYAGTNNVKPGDVVVDVGAHIGTFDDDALRRGAAKVILVEPDPLNVECIRRNFAKEITEGRVIVVPEGAWSSRSSLEFSKGVANSGTGSFVLHEQGGQKIRVPVRPLDEILAELGVTKVDYIKMDIEGAEREALKGGTEHAAGVAAGDHAGPLSFAG
ncbi:MAG: FkbM family methyltransferase [Bryobacterales bacterium]|nr:FkbM family methyltransferase [Bryobacterales bacterium]